MSAPAERAPGRNLVVCSDGTGNSAIKNRGTNVFKIYEALDLHAHLTDPSAPPQLAFYDDGVGTESLKPLRLLTGAFGLGLGRNVRQLYTELCRAYRPGDRLFLFGFSRGAFTVRTLAGLVTSCGIIDARGIPPGDLDRRVDEAYRAYRRKYVSRLESMAGRRPDPDASRRIGERSDVHTGVEIAFLGVWDTVDAVGLPFAGLAALLNEVYRFKFPDHRLSRQVERACHALAIDDERLTFHPLLWDMRGDERPERVSQVWFTGVHANVGGGYPQHGVSLVSLDWMMHEAELQGLRFLPAERESYLHRHNVHDKVYDSRSGPAVYYRYRPRRIDRICAENGIPFELHVSALERILQGTGGYAPGNLPPQATVVDRPSSSDQPSPRRSVQLWDPDDAGDRRRERVVRRWQAVRVWTQRVFYLTTGTVAALPVVGPVARTDRPVAALIDPASYAGAFGRLAERTPALAAAIVLVGLGCFLVGWLAERALRTTHLHFWHPRVAPLRQRLQS